MLLVLLLVALVAALPPRPPTDVAKLDAYFDRHGMALLEAESRAQLDSAHPGGASAASATTIAELSRMKATHLRSLPAKRQLAQLTTMHAKLEWD